MYIYVIKKMLLIALKNASILLINSIVRLFLYNTNNTYMIRIHLKFKIS